MNRLLIIGLLSMGSLCAWEDHPDRDEDRRNEACDSQNYVESGYDWSNRDPDSKDDNSSSSRNEGLGTVLSGPDRDK